MPTRLKEPHQLGAELGLQHQLSDSRCGVFPSLVAPGRKASLGPHAGPEMCVGTGCPGLASMPRPVSPRGPGCFAPTQRGWRLALL